MADVSRYAGVPASRKEARQSGSKYYFTGKPCAQGHLCLRFSSCCACVECQAASRRQHLERNPHYQRDHMRKRRADADNRRRMQEQERDRYWAEPEKHRAKARAHKKTKGGKETISAHNKAHREEKRRLLKNWRDRNPESVIAHNQGRRARQQQAEVMGRVPTSADIKRLTKAAKVCPDCGGRFSKARRRTVDHAIPLARGGLHVIENLRIVCSSCNSSKSDRQFTSNGQGILV